MSPKEKNIETTNEADGKNDATRFVPYKSRGYGAPELKQFYQKFMFRGVVIGVVIVGFVVGLYYVPQLLASDEEPIHTIRLMKYTDLGPPPSITQTAAAPSVAVASTAVKPSIGIPVPVPDAEVNPEQTFATQQELSQTSSPVSEGSGTGGGVAIQPDLKIDDEPPPDFVPYEKEPTVVKKVEPKYPEIALRAGLEGNVFLKVWVTKEGKVREAVIIKSDAEIFNQAAKDAALQWVFTPAVMQKGPVAVWVSIPFRFRLTGK
jgi:periplasmic protein TonB